jgi:hypothetical protein
MEDGSGRDKRRRYAPLCIEVSLYLTLSSLVCTLFLAHLCLLLAFGCQLNVKRVLVRFYTLPLVIAESVNEYLQCVNRRVRALVL